MTTQTPATFRSSGGVHPRYHKDATRAAPIAEMPLPAMLHVSMAQHLGAPAKPLVKKGDAVLRGQLIGEPAGFISAAVHAPTSGTVKQVAPAPTATGGMAVAVDIEPDGEDTWDPAIQESLEARDALIREFNEHPQARKDVVLGIIAGAGIAGMGGAGFPTHVKLSPPPDKTIDTLIVNGAECEPYLTADHRLMVERAPHIWAGCKLIQNILGARTVRIAIEDNKPEAIEAMRAAMGEASGDVAVAVLPTEYPQGAEKQQIYAITGREVPSGGLPMDVGAVVENVGTTLAVWDAVVNGRPLTERVTTVTGSPVSKPANVLNRLGTPYEDLLRFCGGTARDAAKAISGGPMMGFAQASLAIGTTKTTSGLLLLAPAEVHAFTSMPCIACGRCVEACPMLLVRSKLSRLIEAEDFETAESWDVMDCIECGCCAFVCPAHRPMVQHMRRGKGHVVLKRKQEQKS